MRAALALLCLVVTATSCAQSCDAGGLGGIDSDLRFGAMFGDMRPSVDDGAAAPAVVGVNWPSTPAFEYAAYLDVDTGLYADDDAVQTPACRGTLCSSLAVTQGNLSMRPQIQIPCDVGAGVNGVPCYFSGGDDYWVDSVARSALTFLHDGTGASCYFLAEPSSASAGNAPLFASRLGGATSRGFYFRYSSSTTDRWQCSASNGTANIMLLPTGGTGLEDAMWAGACSHGTSRTSDAEVYWRGATLSGGEADYSGTPSSGDPSGPLSILANFNGTSPFTTHFVLGACFAEIHDDATAAIYLDRVEAYAGGTLPL